MHEPVSSIDFIIEFNLLAVWSKTSVCRVTLFLRGAGGFSKSSKPFSYTNYPTNQAVAVKIPKTQPFAVLEDCTQPPQACSFEFTVAKLTFICAVVYLLSWLFRTSEPYIFSLHCMSIEALAGWSLRSNHNFKIHVFSLWITSRKKSHLGWCNVNQVNISTQ